MIGNPEVQRQIADHVGGNYFAVTSSVRGLLIIPKIEEMFSEALGKAADKISRIVGIPGEELSKHICYYNNGEQELSYHMPTSRCVGLAAVGEETHKYGRQSQNEEKTVVRSAFAH